ncbi:hypothetical protein LCGC14_2953260, partial [marine sediment metagenome]
MKKVPNHLGIILDGNRRWAKEKGLSAFEGHKKGLETIKNTIEWCKENGITTKGHPLVWTHSAGVPRWLSKFPVSLTEELLKARVIDIVSGFEGKIDIWDIVNEPIN